ncbi:MAG: DNA-binding response regulator [Flavisolibacter sp.]
MYQMMDAGAVGYIDKTNPFEQIAHAIRNSEKGKKLYSFFRDDHLPSLASGATLPAAYSVFPFSDEELKIIGGICKGMTAKEIARENFITVYQYNRRVRVIKEKMGVKTTSGIALYAFRNGLFKG